MAVNHPLQVTPDASTAIRAEFWQGFRDNIAFQGGALAFGILTGSVSVSSGLSPFQAILFSSAMYAGNSQIVGMQLFADGAPALIVLLAIAIVNARHIMYGASLAPFVRDLTMLQRMFIGVVMVDNNYANANQRFPKLMPGEFSAALSKRLRLAYYGGLVTSSWPVWVFFCVVGVLIGRSVPESWQLGLIPSLGLIGMIVINIKDRPALLAALVAALLAILSNSLPLRFGIVVSGIIAMAAGLLAERRWPQEQRP